jgi:NCS1 family nucleobase:cation symporter-1
VNLFPRRLNFVSAGMLSIVLGFLFVPWLWMDNPETIFKVLGYIGGALGPVAGIMIADFYLVRRSNYDLDSFYDKRGVYGYSGGWNPKALIATALGIIVAFVGLVVPPLSVLLSYSWGLGLVVALVAYTVLMRAERAQSTAEPAMEIAEELS